jgi:hypothetical protein
VALAAVTTLSTSSTSTWTMRNQRQTLRVKGEMTDLPAEAWCRQEPFGSGRFEPKHLLHQERPTGLVSHSERYCTQRFLI